MPEETTKPENKASPDTLGGALDAILNRKVAGVGGASGVLLVALYMLLQTGAGWVEKQVDSMRQAIVDNGEHIEKNGELIEGVRRDLDALQVEQRIMRAASSDRWTESDMKTWASILAAQNTALTVPPVASHGAGALHDLLDALESAGRRTGRGSAPGPQSLIFPEELQQ